MTAAGVLRGCGTRGNARIGEARNGSGGSTGGFVV